VEEREKTGGFALHEPAVSERLFKKRGLTSADDACYPADCFAMNTRNLPRTPHHRRFILSAERVWIAGVALLLAAVPARVQGQPAQPWINLQSGAGGSILLFQLTTQSNWFYTFQQSANLTSWAYAADYYANGASLSWTNPIASNAAEAFFRVTVNPPNPAAYTNYHSWANSVTVNNGLVEAVIVPTIGRVQQFRFLGDTNGAFWENPSLYGQNPSTSSYQNFGGNKAWPAPQYGWGGGWWPPPAGFDGTVETGSFTNGIVTLLSATDTRYGLHVTRTLELLFNEPVMRITTVFTRTAATTMLTSNVSIWIDCQAAVTNTSRCYVPVPSPSIFANGYTLTGDAYFGPTLPLNYSNVSGLISFGPDTAGSHKIGFDSGTLILVGTNLSLRVDAPRVPGAAYPASGCSTEVYTAQYNSSSPYFELELLGPMATLPVGGTMQSTTTYSLFRRTKPTDDVEAQKVLSWQY
jgi:hypothetical protein